MSIDFTILGCGPLGLQVARLLLRLGHGVRMLEKEPTCGGLSRSVCIGGHYADFGPHFLTDAAPWGLPILEEYQRALGEENLLPLENLFIKSLIFARGKEIGYPVKPKEVLLRHGPLLPLGSMLDKILRRRSLDPGCAAEYLQRSFGDPLYRAFFSSYLKKSMGMDPREIDMAWARERPGVLGQGGILGFMKRMMAMNKERTSLHWYPRSGGVGALMEGMAREVREAGGEILTGHDLDGLRLQGQRVEELFVSRAGTKLALPVERVISTIPLPELIAAMGPPPEDMVGAAARRLTYRALCLVYLRIRRPRVYQAPQVYVGDGAIRFKRLYETRSVLDVGPAGETVLCCELCCQEGDATWNAPEERLAGWVLADLGRMGQNISSTEVLERKVVRIRHAYPRYHIGVDHDRARCLDWVDRLENLWTFGRQGEFRYSYLTHNTMRRAFEVPEIVTADRPGAEPRHKAPAGARG